MCHFIVGECPLFSNEVENHLMVTVVTYVTTNQPSIPHHGSYVWSTLKEEIPLAFNFAVHFSLLKCSSNTLLVKDIDYAFEKEVEKTLLFIRKNLRGRT